jgi:hypothetical protein
MYEIWLAYVIVDHCVFSVKPHSPHIIDFNEEDVCIENLKLMTVDDFISAVGKNKNGQ